MNKLIIQNIQWYDKYNFLDFKPYKSGITIIIPTYQGEKRIVACIESLINQSLPKELFQVIFIINGEKDKTENIIKDYIQAYDLYNVKIIYHEFANVSVARNIGIRTADREYITFLDDDDFLSSNYLEKMFKYSNLNKVVISQIADIDESGTFNYNNKINGRIRELEDQPVSMLNPFHSILSMNACKLIPTYVVKKYRYNPELRSGEDVVFFSEMILNENLELKIIPTNENAFYFRLIRDQSISRKREINYDFNVTQRLKVIAELEYLLSEAKNKEKREYMKMKIRSQVSFIVNYIQLYENEIEKVLTDIFRYKLSYFPYNDLYKTFSTEKTIKS